MTEIQYRPYLGLWCYTALVWAFWILYQNVSLWRKSNVLILFPCHRSLRKTTSCLYFVRSKCFRSGNHTYTYTLCTLVGWQAQSWQVCSVSQTFWPGEDQALLFLHVCCFLTALHLCYMRIIAHFKLLNHAREWNILISF